MLSIFIITHEIIHYVICIANSHKSLCLLRDGCGNVMQKQDVNSFPLNEQNI